MNPFIAFRDWWRGWTDQDAQTADRKLALQTEPGEVVWLTKGEMNAVIWKGKRIYGYF